MKIKQWYVYIIRAGDNSLYTGVTTDLKRRFEAHQKGKGAKYLKGRLPIQLVFEHPAETRSHAQRLEHWIKKQPKIVKEKLIQNKTSLPD